MEAIDRAFAAVRGAVVERYALKLDVDRIQWPALDRSSPPRNDPTPRGVLLAEVWIDELGRLVRFSYCRLGADRPKHQKVQWPTTELWDFGVPPQLQDWKSQPVIDPVTWRFPESEREAMRLAACASSGDASGLDQKGSHRTL